MILALLFIAVSIALGYAVVRALNAFKGFEERFFSSIAVGVALGSWIAYLAFYVFGGYAPLAALLFQGASAALIFTKFGKPGKQERLVAEETQLERLNLHENGNARKGFWIRFLPVLVIVFAVTLYSGIHLNAEGGYFASSSYYSDTHHHMTSISNFAYGINIPPQNPYFSGTPFRYSFLMDLYSASLARLGMPLDVAINLPAFLLLASFFALCYFFFLKLYPNKNVACIAVLLLLLAGGFGFPKMLEDINNHPDAANWLTHPDRDYAKAAESGTNQFLLAYMLPQRANDVGYPIAIIIFMLLIDAAGLLEDESASKSLKKTRTGWLKQSEPGGDGGDAKRKRNLFLFAGVLAGLLPSLREFAFLVVMLVACGFFILKRRRQWAYFFIPALLIAVPQLVSSAAFVAQGGSEMIGVELGWRAHTLEPVAFASFWLANLSLPLALAAAGFFIVPKKTRKIALVFFGLFVIANALRFTPDDNNNMKIINFWQIVMSLLAGAAIIRLAETKPKAIAVALAVLTLAVCLLPGALSVVYELQHYNVMYSRGDREFAAFVNANTEDRAVFMSFSSYNAMDLVGRPRVMGFGGTLWTFGEKTWYEREQDQKAFYAGERMLEIIGKYNVSYVAVTPTENRLNPNYQALFGAPFLKTVYDETIDGSRYALLKVVREGFS